MESLIQVAKQSERMDFYLNSSHNNESFSIDDYIFLLDTITESVHLQTVVLHDELPIQETFSMLKSCPNIRTINMNFKFFQDMIEYHQNCMDQDYYSDFEDVNVWDGMNNLKCIILSGDSIIHGTFSSLPLHLEAFTLMFYSMSDLDGRFLSHFLKNSTQLTNLSIIQRVYEFNGDEISSETVESLFESLQEHSSLIKMYIHLYNMTDACYNSLTTLIHNSKDLVSIGIPDQGRNENAAMKSFMTRIKSLMLVSLLFTSKISSIGYC
ncbi:hypothetical protein BC833DRAFT_321666 [Globomyces pollinis-pini]|nr:hypothetical protein BC833DRAFT_321666 [Globomyces pollinis-pini]